MPTKQLIAHCVSGSTGNKIALLDLVIDAFLTDQKRLVLLFDSADAIRFWAAKTPDVKESDLETLAEDRICLNHVNLIDFERLIDKFSNYVRRSEEDWVTRVEGLRLNIQEVRVLEAGLTYYIRLAHSYGLKSLQQDMDGLYQVPNTDPNSARRLQTVLYKDAQERIIPFKILGNPPLVLKDYEVKAYLNYITQLKDSVQKYEIGTRN